MEKPQFSADLAVFLKNAVKCVSCTANSVCGYMDMTPHSSTCVCSVCRWSSAEGSRKRGDPELQLLLARAHRNAGDYTHAAKHYLHAENPSEFADALFDWSKLGYQSEYDLYLARSVLQYVLFGSVTCVLVSVMAACHLQHVCLCRYGWEIHRLLSLENLRDANKVYEEYVAQCKAANRSVDLPLFNFLRFLLLTLEVRFALDAIGNVHAREPTSNFLLVSLCEMATLWWIG